MNTEGWLTAEQAAELLGVQRRSVYYYASNVAGFPQPQRIGRTVLWREAELIEWRKEHPARNRGDR